MHMYWIEKYISINKIRDTIVTTSVDTFANRRNRVLHLGLHHLNSPSLDRNITSKGNLGKNTKCSKGTKGCSLKYKKTEATMDYSFFSLQFLHLNVSKVFLI